MNFLNKKSITTLREWFGNIHSAIRESVGNIHSAIMEWVDNLLSGSILKQLKIYALVSLAIYLSFVLAAYFFCDTFSVSHNDTSFSGYMKGVMYYFFDAGNLHSETSTSAKFITPIISAFGMFLLGGLLVTTLTNIVERRINNVSKGFVTYKGQRGHYVIIGYGEITVCLLNDIFKHEKLQSADDRLPKVIILTNQDAQRVRAQIKSQLPYDYEKNILIYSGDIESRGHIERLNIKSAKEVYILGEPNELGRDSKNLECIRIICELRSKRKCIDPILTVNVQLNRPAFYSAVKKLEIPIDYVNVNGKQVLYFRPFNFYENWARLLWGYYRKDDYDVLDFDPETSGSSHILSENSNRHVHLVIVGFNRMGRALLLEAIRICHFPNFNELTRENKTIITVVDPEMDRLQPLFESQYPYIKDICDIDVRYEDAYVEDARIRSMLENSATNQQELLTVAICQRDPDASLATGLSLPESLYYRTDDNGISVNDNVRILVRQELQKGISTILKADEHKYKNVKVFGMLTEGISRRLLDDYAAMLVNAKYSGKNILDDKERACAPELWYATNEDMRCANRYQIEMYDTYARYENFVSKESLYRMEHLRWCAERRIIGYHYDKIKDKKFKTHPQLIPYYELPAIEKDKDSAVIEIRNLIEKICQTH